jgi:hypothetical protein
VSEYLRLGGDPMRMISESDKKAVRSASTTTTHICAGTGLALRHYADVNLGVGLAVTAV